MVLAGLQGPGQTLFPHFATGTDLLGTLDLGESRASVTVGKKSSGSSVRQAALWRQSIRHLLLSPGRCQVQLVTCQQYYFRATMKVCQCQPALARGWEKFVPIQWVSRTRRVKYSRPHCISPLCGVPRFLKNRGLPLHGEDVPGRSSRRRVSQSMISHRHPCGQATWQVARSVVRTQD